MLVLCDQPWDIKLVAALKHVNHPLCNVINNHCRSYDVLFFFPYFHRFVDHIRLTRMINIFATEFFKFACLTLQKVKYAS